MTTYISTARQARQADARAIREYRIPSLILMEHAAAACAEVIKDYASPEDSIVILCGPGNNGGDGLAIARLLFLDGYKPAVFCPPVQKCSPDEQVQLEAVQALGITCTHDPDTAQEWIGQTHFVVDALFGSGLSRDVEGVYGQLIQAVNDSPAFVFAIDLPSGLQADTGRILKNCVQPDLTLALDCLKRGMFLNEGRQICAEKKVLNITIPSFCHEDGEMILLDDSAAASALPARPAFSHKGTFGRALMIGGSAAMHGAICMAADACVHSGIGTCTLYVPDSVKPIAAMKMDQVMILTGPCKEGNFCLEAVEDLKKQAERFSTASIGNGMGKNEVTEAMVKAMLESSLPLIIDADAIWAAGKHRDLLNRPAPVLLSPHLKEMADLSGYSLDKIKENPVEILLEFSRKFPSCTIILKSDVTFIAHQDHIYALDAPNAALAKGGSGDILCGIACALAGSKAPFLDCALAAVRLHSLAARSGKSSACFQPQDLIAGLDQAFLKLESLKITKSGS